MRDIVQRLPGGDRRPPGGARQHLAGHPLEPETPPLQHDESLDLRICEWEAPAEDVERPAIPADEAGGRVLHRLPQNRPEPRPEKADSESPDRPGVLVLPFDEARTDYHFAPGALEALED